MSANVFANGREVSAKKSSDQSIAAMPDVCLSPPSPPAGPIPIPYPNFSKASDTSDGTKTVKIAGDEAGMKNQSNYKTSKGDEAATRTLGMGVVTHTIQGKTQFAAWSFDVMFEGANAVRFMDLTTHNHASDPANPPSATASTGSPDVDPVKEPSCEELDEANKKDKKRLPPDYAGAGNTNTNWHFKSETPGVASEIKKAHSKIAVQQMFPNEYVEGNPARDRLKAANPDGESNANCEGSTFHYSGEFFKGGHTEARIVEHLFAKSPTGTLSGTLTMKINWQPTGGGQSPAPCEHCHAILCAAAHCGLKIVLCSEKNKPVPMEKDDCADDLDMRKPEVREDMLARNRKLVKRLKPPKFP
jgi:hypothetical protein